MQIQWILWLTILAVQAGSEEEACKPFNEMSLDELISFAKAHSPMLKEADSGIAMARVEISKTHWLSRALPSASFSWGTSLGSVSVENYKLWEESGTQLRWHLSLSWDIDKILSSYERKRAELNLHQAVLDKERTERQLIREVSELYFTLEILKEREQIYEFKVNAKRQLVDYETERYNTQGITLDKLLDSKLELYETERMLLEANHEQFLVKQTVIHLIGF